MNYFSDKTATPLKLKVSTTRLITFNAVVLMIVFMSNNTHEICIIIDQDKDKEMMTEGSEFFLSNPQFITSISDINVYRKTSRTLLRPSNTKKKIRNEKRFDDDRITQVVSRLTETLQNEEISIEEAPPTADVASPSTSTDKSASLYDWLQNPKIKTNLVQMIIIESEIDVTSTVKKAKLLCLSSDGKILTEVIAWANNEQDGILLQNLTIDKYSAFTVHPKMLKNKTDSQRNGKNSAHWKMLRSAFVYKYGVEPTDVNIQASSSLYLRVSTLKPGLGPKVDDKEIARLLRNLVSIESNKGSKSSAATWLANIDVSHSDIEHDGTYIADARPFKVWTPAIIDGIIPTSVMIFNMWDEESAYSGSDKIVIRADFLIDVSPWVLEELDDEDPNDDNGDDDDKEIIEKPKSSSEKPKSSSMEPASKKIKLNNKK